MHGSVVPPAGGKQPLRLLALVAALVILAVAGIAIAFRNTAATVALHSVAHGFGYDLTAGQVNVSASNASLHDVRIRNAAGEPVLDAREIDVGYSLRDLLPGGRRLFGLKSVVLIAPHATVIHHADGSYNITVPPTAAGSSKTNPPPLNTTLRVDDGVVDLIDRFVVAPHERRERLIAIHANGNISPALGSFYHAGAVLEADRHRYPIDGNARFDDPRGYELQHWTARSVPIAGLANFILSTHALVVQAGEVRRLDVKIGALSTAAGTMQPHYSATGELAGGRVAAAALVKPVRDAHGSFVVDDDSATVRTLDAAVNGIPLHLSGALYHFVAPQVAFALIAHGDLARAVALSKDSAKLPIGGAIALHGIIEGPAANPLVFARFGAGQVTYGTYRLDGPRGLVAISGSELDVIDAAIRYGPAAVETRAALLLQKHTQTTAYATFTAPANGLPYIANVVPGMQLGGIAAVSGTDAKLSARGYLAGRAGADRLDAPFALAASGDARFGPLVLERHDGAALYARAAFDRRANRTVALVDVHGLSLLPAPAVQLPGLTVPALPPHLDGKLDATLTGIATGTSISIADAALHAYGPWGDARATADGSAGDFAARGRLVSSFEQLVPFSGNIGARGGIDLPFALTNRGRSTVVQIQSAKFSNASVRGIGLQGLSATLGLAPHAIDVYSADVAVADRRLTAAGSFGNGGRVHVSAGDLDLRAVRAAGIPISDGQATVIADIGGTAAKPTATLLAALAGARYLHTAVGGDIGVAYDGSVLRIERATITYGGAYGNATGAVSGLSLGHIAPRYTIHAKLEDADIATLARVVKTPLRYPQGTLDADVRVGGAGMTPSVAGDVLIPEGSLNGLNFRNARVGVDGNAAAVRATGGRITVGTTTFDFAGNASRTRQAAALQSAHIDLADFNDYFDEAEVLAGTGKLAVAFDAMPDGLTATANVALRNTRYRRFELGKINAVVRTSGTAVHLRAGLDGTNGRVGVTGIVNVPATDPLRDLVRRSDLDLSTQIAGINLGNILPAAGLSVPFVGIVDGAAVVRGRYPALALRLHAALTKGVAGRVPIERLTIAANAANGRGQLTDLTLLAPGLNATASGSFGMRPADAFDVQAHVASPDINTLVATATGKDLKLKGTLETRAHLSGTIVKPRLTSSVDVRNVSYAGELIPSAHADLDATRSAVDVRNGLITLPRSGTIAFDGHAPLTGGARTPIALDFVPHHVDVAAYSPALPDGAVTRGIFDGNVGVRGTLAAPRLSGILTFANGAFRSNTLKSGLTAIALELDFAGTTINVAKLHAHAAPGNIDGSGTVALGDLRDPIRGLTANFDVTVANAFLDAPKFYVGYVDGKATVAKRVSAPTTVGGDFTFSNARIPYTALLPSGGSTQGPAPVLPAVAFDLGVTVGRDVRVQSGPVDIGTVGTAQLGGTLAKPTLNGQFTSTDGTVSLYRTFTVQNGSAVNFDPADGITPSLDATAVTSVPDPPTDVLLRITGPSTHLNLAFSSEPAYSQQQILGLLINAQAFGAVAGVAQSSGSTANAPSISGIGEGVLNTQLTQKFLQPFSSKLGGALGLSDLNINYNTSGAISASARRRLGKNISFTYGEQIGGPTPRTSVGINIGTAISGAQLTFFQASGSQQAFGGQALTPFLQSGFLATSPPNYTLQAISPPSGSGFVFSYQRHF